MMTYNLTRSSRKTLALYVRNGTVEVHAPMKMPRRDIDIFVASKEKWIADKLAKSNEQIAQRDSFTLHYGDTITLRGKQYTITAKTSNRAGFDGECFYMPPDMP